MQILSLIFLYCLYNLQYNENNMASLPGTETLAALNKNLINPLNAELGERCCAPN